MAGKSLEFWQEAYSDAQLVRESLVRASQMSKNDSIGAIACVQDALHALASMRSRATQSSALLGVVLYYGIELEVRLEGIADLPKSSLEAALTDELERSSKLLQTIENHLDED